MQQPFSFNFFSGDCFDTSTQSSSSVQVKMQVDCGDKRTVFDLSEVPRPKESAAGDTMQICRIKQLELSVCSACDRLQGVPEDTDIVPGQYEGGLQIWECSRDLGHRCIVYLPIRIKIPHAPLIYSTKRTLYTLDWQA